MSQTASLFIVVSWIELISSTRAKIDGQYFVWRPVSAGDSPTWKLKSCLVSWFLGFWFLGFKHLQISMPCPILYNLYCTDFREFRRPSFPKFAQFWNVQNLQDLHQIWTLGPLIYYQIQQILGKHRLCFLPFFGGREGDKPSAGQNKAKWGNSH